jgi:hypothetical protein
MKSEITITVDKQIIKQANEYAKNNKINLSILVENHLILLIKKQRKGTQKT